MSVEQIDKRLERVETVLYGQPGGPPGFLLHADKFMKEFNEWKETGRAASCFYNIAQQNEREGSKLKWAKHVAVVKDIATILAFAGLILSIIGVV